MDQALSCGNMMIEILYGKKREEGKIEEIEEFENVWLR